MIPGASIAHKMELFAILVQDLSYKKAIVLASVQTIIP